MNVGHQRRIVPFVNVMNKYNSHMHVIITTIIIIAAICIRPKLQLFYLAVGCIIK